MQVVEEVGRNQRYVAVLEAAGEFGFKISSRVF